MATNVRGTKRKIPSPSGTQMEQPRGDECPAFIRTHSEMMDAIKALSGSDSLQTGVGFSRKNFAMLVVDHKGGKLCFSDRSLTMTIPENAIPGGEKRVIFCYRPAVQEAASYQERFVKYSPVIVCGPDKYNFKEKILLKFQHCAKPTRQTRRGPLICILRRLSDGFIDHQLPFDIDGDSVTLKLDHFSECFLSGAADQQLPERELCALSDLDRNTTGSYMVLRLYLVENIGGYVESIKDASRGSGFETNYRNSDMVFCKRPESRITLTSCRPQDAVEYAGSQPHQGTAVNLPQYADIVSFKIRKERFPIVIVLDLEDRPLLAIEVQEDKHMIRNLQISPEASRIQVELGLMSFSQSMQVRSPGLASDVVPDVPQPHQYQGTRRSVRGRIIDEANGIRD